MRILILSDSDSPHTLRWAKSINGKNIIVAIFSIHKPNYELYKDTPNIFLFSLNLEREIQFKGEAAFSKLYYLKAVKKIKEVINNFKPDILHSHYATSYGFLGALTGFHPYIISVWGSDIFSFPNHSIIHKQLLKYNLSNADYILSTSNVMKEETKKFTNKDIIVTPFGVNINIFCPKKVNSIFGPDDFVIGTIKTLEKNYGLEYLIKAFHLIKEKYSEKRLKLILVGKGSEKSSLENLVRKLGIQDDTVFTGFIDSTFIPEYHNMIHINVIPSINESFGVSAVEAMACGKPVIASNIGGLKEI